MKRLMPITLGTVILAATLAANVRAETLLPGQIDFGTFSPPGEGGEFVEVNLSSSLITLASRFAEKADADVAQLLKGLHQVHVNVIGLNDENRPELEKRVQDLRKQMDKKGWERIVTAQKDGQDVSVYLKTQNKDTVQGLVVLVMDGTKQAVFVNIVGDIKPDQVAMLGDKLHLDALKKAGAATEK
jgi:Na+-translocating ferredoxin:NAD+ oxidoreductase RnfG subunit